MLIQIALQGKENKPIGMTDKQFEDADTITMSNLQFGIKRFGNFQCEERDNHNKNLWEIEESHWRKIVEQNLLETAIIQSKDEEWSTNIRTFKYVQLYCEKSCCLWHENREKEKASI